jgi:hypothetical protein
LGAPEITGIDRSDREILKGLCQLLGLAVTLACEGCFVGLSLYQAEDVPCALIVSHQPENELVFTVPFHRYKTALNF